MKNFIALLTVVSSLFSCGMAGQSVTGNGNVKEEKRDIADFHGIATSGSIEVEIVSGDNYSVKVSNDQNLLQYVVTEIKDGVLNVYYKSGYNINNDHAKVLISAPSLDKIATSGSGDISGDGTIKNTNEITFSLSGSGDVTANVDAPSINVRGSGSGDIKLSGRTKDFECKMSGSGNVQCTNLQSENVVVSVAGSSDVHVFASVHLKVNVAGSGDVYYSGNPSSPEIHIAGSGTVQAQK